MEFTSNGQTKFCTLFRNIKIYTHIEDSTSVHHQFFTVHTAIGISITGYADCLLASSQ